MAFRTLEGFVKLRMFFLKNLCNFSETPIRLRSKQQFYNIELRVTNVSEQVINVLEKVVFSESILTSNQLQLRLF